MNLYLLKPREGLDRHDDPWEFPYDKAHGFVIRAESHRAARKIAATKHNHGDEGDQVWLDPTYSECTTLKSEGEEGVVIGDYTNG